MSASWITAVAIVAAFAMAAVVVRVAHVVVRRLLDRMQTGSAENRAAVHARARQLIRALELLAYGIAVLASISLALSRFGVRHLRWEPRLLGDWVLTHGVNVVVIVVGATIVTRAANLAVEHLQHQLGFRRAQSDLEWQRRASNLGGILTSLVTTGVSFIAALMVLRELDIDIVPILTGAGIAGLAIGFGAQNLVRDFISGFFIILEDQVRVGDLARINGVAGVVEEINLRTIVVRDGDGAVQVFPNGTITALANLSKHFAFAVVDIRVTYTENVDRAIETIREVGSAMREEPDWAPLILEPVQVLGVEAIADGFATLRARFKTRPLNQGKVANELRRRLMTTFSARGIRPYGRQ
jgi:moderate conductance mechanosensitive channel